MPKNTITPWKYSTQKVGKDLKNYFALSMPPKFYPDFLNKELVSYQCGSSIIFTISGCKQLR